MKKIFIIALASLAAVSCCNKKLCQIKGDVQNLPEGMIYLATDYSPEAIIDSVAQDNGKFAIKARRASGIVYLCDANKEPFAKVYVSGNKALVSGDIEIEVTVTGNAICDKANEFSSKVQDIVSRYRADPDNTAIIDEYNAYIDSTIEAEKENVLGAELLIRQKMYEMSGAEMLAAIEAMPAEVQAYPFVARAVESCRKKIRTEPQAEGSDFVPYYIDVTQPNAKGEMISLKSIIEKKGNRYVLVDFWASWCGPCMGEVPTLVAEYAKYHKKGFEIYGISFDRDAKAWTDTMAEAMMNWVNVSAFNGEGVTPGEEYAVESIPTNFLIDCATGIIIDKNLRGESVGKRLAELMGR